MTHQLNPVTQQLDIVIETGTSDYACTLVEKVFGLLHAGTACNNLKYFLSWSLGAIVRRQTPQWKNLVALSRIYTVVSYHQVHMV
jgi:hypothetical protein